MQDCTFTGMFPIARIDLSDPDVPLKIVIEDVFPSTVAAGHEVQRYRISCRRRWLRRIGFIPRVSSKDFGCFFSVATAWGCFRQKSSQKVTKVSVEVDKGKLPLRELVLSKNLCHPRSAIVKAGTNQIKVDRKRET